MCDRSKDRCAKDRQYGTRWLRNLAEDDIIHADVLVAKATCDVSSINFKY